MDKRGRFLVAANIRFAFDGKGDVELAADPAAEDEVKEGGGGPFGGKIPFDR